MRDGKSSRRTMILTYCSAKNQTQRRTAVDMITHQFRRKLYLKMHQKA